MSENLTTLNQPLVSVIINCRNSEKYITECINSVINQTYKNLELVLLNNQSTDRTKDIIEGISATEKRLKYFETARPLTLGSARNAALMHCTGTLIAFLDSDDLWAEDNLESQVHALTENLELGFCFASSFDIFGHENNLGLVGSNSIVKKEITSKNHFRDLLWGNYIYISGFIFRANLLEKVGLFDDNFVHAEDYDFILRIAKHDNGANVGSILYRIHEFNLSKFQFHESHIEVLQILRSNRETKSSLTIETMILFRYFKGSLLRRELKRFFESEKMGSIILAKIAVGATVHYISALKRHINRFFSVLR